MALACVTRHDPCRSDQAMPAAHPALPSASLLGCTAKEGGRHLAKCGRHEGRRAAHWAEAGLQRSRSLVGKAGARGLWQRRAAGCGRFFVCDRLRSHLLIPAILICDQMRQRLELARFKFAGVLYESLPALAQARRGQSLPYKAIFGCGPPACPSQGHVRAATRGIWTAVLWVSLGHPVRTVAVSVDEPGQRVVTPNAPQSGSKQERNRFCQLPPRTKTAREPGSWWRAKGTARQLVRCPHHAEMPQGLDSTLQFGRLLRPLAKSRKSQCWPPLQALLVD